MSYGAEYVAVTEAMANGEIRGSLDECSPTAKRDWTTLTVDRILYGATRPFSSSVESPLPGMDVVKVTPEENTQRVWQQYLDMSEQGKSSRLLLLHDSKKEWSGGLMVKSMGRKGSSTATATNDASDGEAGNDGEAENDDDDDDLIMEFSDWWDQSATSEGGTFMSESSSLGLDGALEHFLSDSPLASSLNGSIVMENARAKSCDFHCRCTREQFLTKVSSLPVPEILEILNGIEGTLDLTCHHCNKTHQMSCDDLESMLSS